MSQTDYREEEILGKGFDAALMRRLMRYLKPYRWYVFGAILLLLIASLFQLAGPYLLKVAVDDYILIEDAETLGPLSLLYQQLLSLDGLNGIALIYLLILAGELIAGLGQLYLMEWIGQRTMLDLRRQLFGHVQRMHLAFFDKNPSGRLLTRITNDVNALNDLFASGAVAIVGNLLQVIGIVAVMFYISSRLALITFIILPLIIVTTILFRRKARQAYRMVRMTLARLNAFVQEHLAGITVVQVFVQERKTLRKFDKINTELKGAHQKSVLYFATFFPIVEVIGAISLALILWYGGGGVLDGVVTFGTLVAFIYYAEKFYRPIRQLAENYNILQSAMAASERVFKLLDSKPEIVPPSNPVSLDGYNGGLKFENVSFHYEPDEPVLDGVSFSVEPGEKVALVGATGAGKTTAVSLICRFYDTKSGRITFDDIEIKDLHPLELRSRLGLVLQDVFLFSGTLRENISLGSADIDDQKILAAARRVGLLPFIEKLPKGLDYNVGEHGSLLSVGQRQLVSFARALVNDPKVLILDEATSSVDTMTEHVIQQALRKLFEGRTSVIVAHRLSTIKEADKILVFHKGKIVEEGKHDELLSKRGVYWRLYQLQYKDQEAA